MGNRVASNALADMIAGSITRIMQRDDAGRSPKASMKHVRKSAYVLHDTISVIGDKPGRVQTDASTLGTDSTTTRWARCTHAVRAVHAARGYGFRSCRLRPPTSVTLGPDRHRRSRHGPVGSRVRRDVCRQACDRLAFGRVFPAGTMRLDVGVAARVTIFNSLSSNMIDG